jgi:hypothetical protein
MACYCKKSTNIVNLPPIEETYRTYMGAGTIFTNGDLILCGYEPNKKIPAIYGIGGKKEKSDTTFYHTAFRETFEELFGVGPSNDMIELIVSLNPPKKILKREDYIMILYDFEDLTNILKIANNIKSPLYAKMPKTIEELLLKRNYKISTEMSHICILPVVLSPAISRNLSNDMKLIISL